MLYESIMWAIFSSMRGIDFIFLDIWTYHRLICLCKTILKNSNVFAYVNVTFYYLNKKFDFSLEKKN